MATFPTHRSLDTIYWPQLNQDHELVPAHLIHSFGPAIYEAIRPVWRYALSGPDSIVPVNHVLRFRTFGKRVRLRAEVERRVDVELVTDRAGDTLRRAHLACHCELADPAAASSATLLATGEFWMALTRPLAPVAERGVTALPNELQAIEERSLAEGDLAAESIDRYRVGPVPGERFASGHHTVVFHYDRSDLYQHVNTVVYMQIGLDQLALSAHHHGFDAATLRFDDLTIYFRKPFMPGQVARVETELRLGAKRFVAAVRYRHLDATARPSRKVSTAMRIAGPIR